MSICTCTPKQKASGKQSPVCEAHMGFRQRIVRKKPLTLLQSYKNDLAFIQGKYEEELNFFANRVRAHWVIPACEKYKLRYLSGNGMYFFTKSVHGQRIDIHCRQDAHEHGISRGLDKVFELLTITVDRQHDVGDLVADYPEENDERNQQG